MKRVSRPNLINEIRKADTEILHPEFVSYVPYEKLKSNFYNKYGDELILNFEKIRYMTDSNIIELLSSEAIINLLESIEYNEIPKINKSFQLIPTDLVNKSLPSMINSNISIKDINYTFMIEEKDQLLNFSYKHIVVLRAIYNLAFKDIYEFSINDIYYQIFQCYGEKIFISTKIKKEIEETVDYLTSIHISLHHKLYDYKINDWILPIKKNDSEKIIFQLTKEPCLLTFSKSIKQFVVLPRNLSKYNGLRSMTDITLYTCILDFAFGFFRSSKNTMRINLKTIFTNCDINLTSRNKKHDMLCKIQKNMNVFLKENLFVAYQIKKDNTSFTTLYVHKNQKEKSMKKSLIEAKNTIEKVLDNKRYECV